MLRMIFVTLLVMIGTFFAVQSPFYGLLFYFWNAYFRPEDWTYGELIISLRLSLIIGAYVVIRTIFSSPSWKVNLRTTLLWLFFAQALLGAYTSEDPTRSWVFFDAFWRVLVITYMIVVLVNDRKQFRLVLMVMTLSLGFEATKQGWVNLVRAPGQPNTNPIPFLGDNNGVAMGMMMLLPMISALAQTSGAIWERNMHRFVAVGVLLRGITTYSRGGFLGAAALMTVMVLRAEKKFRAAIVIAVLAVGIWNLMPQAFWDRMNTIQVEDESQRDESAAGRLHFWRVGMDMADAKPWTGVGLNAFNSAFQKYNNDQRFTDQERSAHSNWFGVLGDLGYPGLILFVGNLGLAFWSCWRVHQVTRKRPEFRELRIYANALISALVVYAVTGTFLSQQYNEMAWHMIGLSTALHMIAMSEVAAAAGPAVEQRKIA